jgi:DNA mismatch repair protein MutS2
MAQSGMPVPVAPGSKFPVFDNVFADIGDEQSIEHTLSTFSWHITNLVRIVKNVTGRSLVLMDELGTSTDPAEGSALARALLLFFARHNTMTVATTHFSELKAFAHNTPGLQNASLDFDPVTLAPTYHLTVGIPGGSNALATASRFGLPDEIVAEARGMLTRGSRELETLLNDLVVEKQGLDSQRTLIEREKSDIEKKSRNLENELEKLKSDERRIINEIRDRVVRESADLFRNIREISTQLRKERSRDKIDQARRTLAAVQEKLKSEALMPPPGETIEEEKISPGDTVWVNEGNVIGTVITIFENSRQVGLQIGSAKLTVSLDSVRKMEKPSKFGIVEPPPVITTVEKKRVLPELDLRGRRAEEIKELVDSYLDDAAISGLARVRIIHGHGTGVVRQIVREMLASHPLVKSWRPGGRGEGGDGVAVATLR